jgi:hypothetical protein
MWPHESLVVCLRIDQHRVALSLQGGVYDQQCSCVVAWVQIEWSRCAATKFGLHRLGSHWGLWVGWLSHTGLTTQRPASAALLGRHTCSCTMQLQPHNTQCRNKAMLCTREVTKHHQQNKNRP